ncbi:MAG TPA: hypothetical protein VHV08_09195 [Pirellulales bacterium]|jgi:hypothetical protein|nr:hypothetical protein [Pirellulales bacterium]
MKRSKKAPAQDDRRQTSFRWLPGLWGLALVVLVACVYAPTLGNGFIWDDDAYVEHNPTLLSLAGLRDIWLKPGAVPQYYPLVHTTFWMEHHLWGLDPFGYHLVNLLLHAVAVLLVWRLLVRLAVPGAWLAAAIFAVHPVGVESVAWITERKNVLSAALALGALLAYLSFSPPNTAGPPCVSTTQRGRWGFYFLALTLFVGALLSKTVGQRAGRVAGHLLVAPRPVRVARGGLAHTIFLPGPDGREHYGVDGADACRG